MNETGGLGSIVFRPPKKWARLAGVRPGDEVVVVFGVGSLLIVAPSGKESEIDQLVEAAERGR